MKYDFRTHVCRIGTGAFKTDAATINGFLGVEYHDDSISMWVADMDFACAPAIVERIKQRADKLIFGYTGMTEEYKRSIINWYARRYEILLNEDWIVYSAGTVLAIKNAIYAFSEKQDEVIIQSPVYFPFSEQIKEANRIVSDNTLIKNENNEYSINFEDFEEKCKTAKLFILCNPHNPTGDIWSQNDVQRLLEITKKYGVIVFSDEVHSDLIRHHAKYNSALSYKEYEHVVVATAVNKTFNLAGLHATNIIIKNRILRAKFNKQAGMGMISPFTLEATIAAYNECEAWLDELRSVLDENVAYVDAFVKEQLPKVKFNAPLGTYLGWLDFNAYGIEEEVLIKRLASEAHIVVEGGGLFGKSGTGFIRLNLACPLSVVKDAMQRIKNMNL